MVPASAVVRGSTVTAEVTAPSRVSAENAYTVYAPAARFRTRKRPSMSVRTAPDEEACNAEVCRPSLDSTVITMPAWLSVPRKSANPSIAPVPVSCSPAGADDPRPVPTGMVQLAKNKTSATTAHTPATPKGKRRTRREELFIGEYALFVIIRCWPAVYCITPAISSTVEQRRRGPPHRRTPARRGQNPGSAVQLFSCSANHTHGCAYLRSG